MTTEQVATAVSRTPTAVRRQAARFARAVLEARGVIYIWPDTAPDGRQWSPEVWRELVRMGKPRCTMKLSDPQRTTLERLAAGDVLDGYLEPDEGVWRYWWNRGKVHLGPVHATVTALKASGMVTVKGYPSPLAVSVSLTEAGRAAVAPE